jgi:anti-anti-sigma regulatory factor
MAEPDSLQVESRDGGLIIRLSGHGLIERKQKTMQAIIGAMKEHQARAVLIDIRAVPPPYVFMDRYQIGELVARYFTGRAVAALINNSQAGEQKVGTLVAANRGVPVQLFTEVARAEQWLQNQSAAKPAKP